MDVHQFSLERQMTKSSHNLELRATPQSLADSQSEAAMVQQFQVLTGHGHKRSAVNNRRDS